MKGDINRETKHTETSSTFGVDQVTFSKMSAENEKPSWREERGESSLLSDPREMG